MANCHFHPYDTAVAELEITTNTIPPSTPTLKREWPLCQQCLDDLHDRFTLFFHGDTRFASIWPVAQI